MLDHFVILVRDLEQAAADYEALGFTVQTRADKSPSHGANYRFVVMADGSYLLLTQFLSDEVIASHRLGADLAEGEGFSDYSFTLADVDATAAQLAELGLPTRGPVAVENVLEDGSEWGLRLLMTGKGAAGADTALPFVVSDTKGREFRIPAYIPHANGAGAIKGLRLTSANAQDTANSLAVILGNPLDQMAYSIEVLPDQRAQKFGRARGGLYEILIDGPADGLLDLAKSHGARLILG